jgi:hypothetical protein
MSKGWYRTTFDDGSSEVAEAENATEAKTAAKNARITKVDPARSMMKADLTKHGAVKVTRVEELTEDQAREQSQRRDGRHDRDEPRPRPYSD